MNEINIENNLSVENNNNNIDNDIENNIDNDIEDNIYNNIENNNSLYNNYNTKIKKDVLNAFDLANKAKLNGIDGENFVSIEKTNNLIERVIGLLTVFEPRLIDEEIRKKIKEDLIEFEKKYSKSDWRVGMEMAFLFATNNYIKFDNEKDAIDLGVRFGFAYLTSGVVSSPIEGYIGLDIRKTRNGKEYFALKYAGPIRNAGGTAASVSVLIADYLRKKLNYAKYDPTQEEVERTIVELNNYHDRVSNLQYLPSDRETEFFFKNLPVQIDGDPTSELEVSNFKNIPRINTNRIRGGFCLVCSECLQLKAQKIKKKLDDWGKEMNLDDWDFLKEYLEIQKQMKTKSVDSKINSKEEIKEETNIKIKENYSYLKEISAGKPVFSYPMKEGFRIRYGRTRLSGYSCSGLNPISMKILDDFIGYGTQIKTERPFKGATITPCDSIEGPIVKLKNGYVVKIKSLEEFKKYSKEISKILHVGDILVNFGDFYNRNHNIIPSGYVEEWWIQDLLYKLIDLKLINLKKIGINDINQDNKMIISRIIKKGDIAYFLNLDLMSKEINIPKENLELIFNEYLTYEISFMDSLVISLKYNIPMHPKHLFFISNINIYEYEKLIEKLKNIGFFFKKIKDKSNFKDDLEKDLKNDVKNFYDSINKLVIENEDLSIEKPVKEEKIKIKELFEKMLIPHSFIDNKIILEADVAKAFIFSFIKIKDNEIEEFMKSEMYVVTDDFISENNYSKEFPKLFFYETKISTENVIGELNKRFEVPLIKNKNSIYMGLRLGRPEKAKPREIKGGYNGLFTLGDFKNENLKNNSKEYLYLNSKIYSQKFYCESCEIYSPLSSCVFCGKSLEPISFDSNWSDKKNNFGFWDFDSKKFFSKFKEKYNLKDEDFDNVKFLDRLNNSEKFSEHYLKGILRNKHGLNVNKDGTVRFDATQSPMTHFIPKEINVTIEQLKNLGYYYDTKGDEIIDENQIIELFPQDIILPDFKDYNNISSIDFFMKVSNFIDDLLIQLYDKKGYYNLKIKEDLIGHYFIALSPHTSAGVVTRVIGFSKTQCLIAHPILHAALRRDCDGDEAGLMLLMDGLLNFSKKFISNNRGATMDRPLVLSLNIDPNEVDDMVFDIDIENIYNIDFYKNSKDYLLPNKFKKDINSIQNLLNENYSYNSTFFTHSVSNLNETNLISSYKYLPTMFDKVKKEVELMERLNGVDSKNAISLMIDKFFIKDMKGNLRKFFKQNLRCTKCNTIIKRPTLSGKCPNCQDQTLVFTIAPNSIIKYLDIIDYLKNKLDDDNYSKSNMEYLLNRISNVIKNNETYQLELN